MRVVFALALVLFVLALAHEFAPRLGSAQGDGLRAADRALEIVASGHGTMLPPAHLAGHIERIDDFIRIGDRLLVGDGGHGLRMARLVPGGELLDERRFDVRLERGARALREQVESARVGEILVLASSGSLHLTSGYLEDPAASMRPEVEEALEMLGAVARLGEVAPESWALIALRGARGWTPLAEAHSIDSGVVVSFVLAPGLEPAPGFRGDFARVRAGGRSEIELAGEMARAWDQRGTRPAPEARLHGRPMAGIGMTPIAGGRGESARLTWEPVPIGEGAGFVAWLGLPAYGGASVTEFSLWVDGEEVGTQAVPAGAPWKVFLVDLSRFAGRRVSLELRAWTAADSPRELLVGRPMLLRGYERSPLEVWAQR